MMISKRFGEICKAGFLLIGTLFVSIGTAYSATLPAKFDPNEWKKVAEAAKKEAKIVMSGSPSQEWRKTLVDMFRDEYPEIEVEYTGISARDFWPRLRKEQALGQKLWDLRAGGVDLVTYTAKRDGFLDPIRPLLLPEIADDRNWVGGLDGLFGDREKKFVPTYTMTISRTTMVNRDFIKEGELKISNQLLDPKFKGKIVIQTPTAGGSFSSLCNLSIMYGESFVRELLLKQNLVVTNDARQQAEWVVRGRYPIAVGIDEAQLIAYRKQELGQNIKNLEDKIIPVGTSFGGIFLFNKAPHPNAARVYINWLLSKNTQTKLSKNVLLNSKRIDVPPAIKELVVDPTRLSKYYLYTTEEAVEISNRLLPMFKDALKL